MPAYAAHKLNALNGPAVETVLNDAPGVERPGYAADMRLAPDIRRLHAQIFYRARDIAKQTLVITLPVCNIYAADRVVVAVEHAGIGCGQRRSRPYGRPRIRRRSAAPALPVRWVVEQDIVCESGANTSLVVHIYLLCKPRKLLRRADKIRIARLSVSQCRRLCSAGPYA